MCGGIEFGVDLIGRILQLAAVLRVFPGKEHGKLPGVFPALKQSGDCKGLRIPICKGECHGCAELRGDAHPLQQGGLDGDLAHLFRQMAGGQRRDLNLIRELADVIGHHVKAVHGGERTGLDLHLIVDPLIPTECVHLLRRQIVKPGLLDVGDLFLSLRLLAEAIHHHHGQQRRGQQDRNHHKGVAHAAGLQALPGHQRNHSPADLFIHCLCPLHARIFPSSIRMRRSAFSAISGLWVIITMV